MFLNLKVLDFKQILETISAFRQGDIRKIGREKKHQKNLIFRFLKEESLKQDKLL